MYIFIIPVRKKQKVFAPIHPPIYFPYIHLYYITFQPPCQHTIYIINKILTIIILHLSSLISYSQFPTFLFKMITRRSRFLHLRTAGSINEKRFDGDPNEVRGRGEKTKSFRVRRVWEPWVPNIQGYNRLKNRRVFLRKAI